MGLIKNRVRKAFALYHQGDLAGCIRELVDCADRSVCYQFHRTIMDSEVEECLKEDGLA